jgi:hypothetical protein
MQLFIDVENGKISIRVFDQRDAGGKTELVPIELKVPTGEQIIKQHGPAKLEPKQELAPKPKKPDLKTCIICGEEFSGHALAKVCSLECRTEKDRRYAASYKSTKSGTEESKSWKRTVLPPTKPAETPEEVAAAISRVRTEMSESPGHFNEGF